MLSVGTVSPTTFAQSGYGTAGMEHKMCHRRPLGSLAARAATAMENDEHQPIKGQQSFTGCLFRPIQTKSADISFGRDTNGRSATWVTHLNRGCESSNRFPLLRWNRS